MKKLPFFPMVSIFLLATFSCTSCSKDDTTTTTTTSTDGTTTNDFSRLYASLVLCLTIMGFIKPNPPQTVEDFRLLNVNGKQVSLSSIPQ